MERFTIESFGAGPVPMNWKQIVSYLNEKDGDPNDIWEDYWNGKYPDAPVAKMELESIDEAAEMLLWMALGDLSMETCLFTPKEFDGLGITCTVEEIEDALWRVDGSEYILQTDIYEDEDLGMVVDATLSTLFSWPEDDDDEVTEFQESGKMERMVNAHLNKYGLTMSECWC